MCYLPVPLGPNILLVMNRVGVLLQVGLVGFVELFAVLPLFFFNILAEFPHQPWKGPLAKEKVHEPFWYFQIS
jgi:hypothetical protein